MDTRLIRILGAHVDAWRDTVVAAIDATRPAGEVWSVTAAEMAAGVLRIDFAKDFETPRSITLAIPRGTTGRTLLYRMSCYLLRKEWPGAVEVH
jgi:hypothetical protein